MESAGLVALALVLGALVGAGTATIIVLAARAGRRAAAAASATLPAGIEAVLAALDLPAVLVDASGIVVAASPTAADADLVASGTLHRGLQPIVRAAREANAPVRRELELARPTPGDTVRHLTVTASLVDHRFALVMAIDRTEAVQLEAVRRDFVANVSHELKTPIGAVALLAEAVDSAADDAAQVRRFAARLSEEADRLAEMTRDLIELSRVQGLEPFMTRSEAVRVERIVTAAVEQNRVAADAKRIELVVRGERGLVVSGDAPTLVTAVSNLIVNAIQYAPERSRIGIGYVIRDATVELSVADQGPGIPEEEQRRVFERFYRGDPARSRGTGGTGLGLSIVKHAVAAHGGEVRLWSQLGRGTTFTIRLPLAAVDIDTATDREPPAAHHRGATA